MASNLAPIAPSYIVASCSSSKAWGKNCSSDQSGRWPVRWLGLAASASLPGISAKLLEAFQNRIATLETSKRTDLTSSCYVFGTLVSSCIPTTLTRDGLMPQNGTRLPFPFFRCHPTFLVLDKQKSRLPQCLPVI